MPPRLPIARMGTACLTQLFRGCGLRVWKANSLGSRVWRLGLGFRASDVRISVLGFRSLSFSLYGFGCRVRELGRHPFANSFPTLYKPDIAL